MAASKQPSNEDYQNLGKAVENVLMGGYFTARNRRQLWWDSFIKGILSGFGGVLGATILVAILVWILSLFNQLPFLDHVSQAIRNAVNAHR